MFKDSSGYFSYRITKDVRCDAKISSNSKFGLIWPKELFGRTETKRNVTESEY